MTAAVHEGSSGQRDLGTVALPYTFVNRERKGPTNSATVKVSVCWAWRSQPNPELGEAEQSSRPPELQLVPGLETLNHPSLQGYEHTPTSCGAIWEQERQTKWWGKEVDRCRTSSGV